METSFQPPEEKRYSRFLNALGTFVPILGVLSAASFTALFLSTDAWQMLAAAGSVAAATIGFSLVRPLLARGRNWPAAATMINLSAVLMAALALFWSGAGVSLTLGLGVWIITGAIAMLGLPPGNRRSLAPIASALACAAIIVIDLTAPFRRLQITDLEILRWLVPLIVILGGALVLSIWIGGMTTRRLFTRLLVAFLLIVTIPIVTLGTASTIERIQTDREYAENNLNISITDRQDSVETWLQGIEADLILAARDPEALEHMRAYLTRAPGESLASLKEQIDEHFFAVLNQSTRLQEIFLMDSEGTVVAGTHMADDGRDYQEQEFFQNSRDGLFLTPSFYYFDDGQETAIIASYPVTDLEGHTIGALAGRVNMGRFETLITTSDPDYPRITYYLVDSDYNLLTSSLPDSPARLENEATRAAMATQAGGVTLYENSLGEPVISVYRWIPAIRSVLLAELPREIAYANLDSLLLTNITLAIVTAAIAVAGAYLTIRTLTGPINRLATVARQVASGNLNARAEIEQKDEIGTLARAMNDMTAQLQGLVTDLGKRVEERTHDLERRSLQLRTAAEVARDASTAGSLDELLGRAARLIQERFEFYHVGIFLLDENGEYAVLRAATGEVGQLMLANKHRVRVGEVDMVGYVTKNGEAQASVLTGVGANYFRNPLLPYTHSQMVLPFKVDERVTGALDIQNDKARAFDQDDIAIMQVMADQLAVAIEKTRLLQEVERNILEMERSYREHTASTWRAFAQQSSQQPGYRFEGITPEPLEAPPPESREAMTRGTSIIVREANERGGSLLAVPIRLRGQTIGVLNLRFQGREVPGETSLLVEEVANRLALALENARLVQEAQRLARRERQVNLITSQIQQATDLDTILQNTVRELGDALGVPRTFIQIGITPATGPDKEN